MSIQREHTSEDHDPSSRLPGNIHTIAKAIDADTRYSCFLPPAWNGDLMMYAQSSSHPPLPNSRRHAWLTRGYALAIARYPQVPLSQSGQDTYHLQQLRSFFARRCGTPQQVYEIGDGPDQHPAPLLFRKRAGQAHR